MRPSIAAGDRVVTWVGRYVAVAIVLTAIVCYTLPSYGQDKGSGLSFVPAPPGFDPTHNVLYAFTPNDPYYNTGNPAGFPGQWHLDTQTSGAVFDVNIVGAWNRNLTGQGVTIGIVDDSLQHAHPDLTANYVAADSEDFRDGLGGDVDPSPVYSNVSATNRNGDNHGTSVAGVAAARGGNQTGVTGAAPLANLAGLRVDFPLQTQFMFINATLFHSSGNNTNIKVKNHSYGVSAPYIVRNGQANALVTSHDAGTIHVFAAGNERTTHGTFTDVNNNGIFDPDVDLAIDGDANKKHVQSLQETIDVAALASSGIFADYSNWGANVWVTAPSRSFRPGEFSILTTDRTGGATATGGYNLAAGDADTFPDLDYVSTFGGTSSAAPLVSGIMALAKQAQPSLDTRMAKHLLALTSNVIDPADATATSNCVALPVCAGGWITNGAGFNFNQNYGFGLVDADELTREATNYVGVTPLVTETIGTTGVGLIVPDANPVGIAQNFLLTGLSPLEEVEVRLNVSHVWRGDVEAFLTSPMGTTSRLMYQNIADSFNNINNWNFVSNEFWGEIPLGLWTLTVRDVRANDVGTWNNFSVLAKMGSLIPVPEPGAGILALLCMTGLVWNRGRGL